LAHPSQSQILFMADCPDHSLPPGRRRALVVFVNATLAVIGGGLSALLGVFALRPPNGGAAGRWVRAGSTAELKAGEPTARILSVARVNGWYRERARETVFLVWDGHDSVRALSATCTHLGCQVQWDAEGKKFKCPCHGGVYSHDGTVVSGPPPRPLDVVEARIDPGDASVLVRL
jgi:Rieske Fe-S protein